MLSLDWGIESLWHALNDDEHADTEEPDRHAHSMIVWRFDPGQAAWLAGRVARVGRLEGGVVAAV
jgi:hypothetical protein